MSRRGSRSTRSAARRLSSPIAAGELLEARVVLAAGIAYDRNSRTLSIVGSDFNDSAEVRQQGGSIVVTMTAGSAASVVNPPAKMTRTLDAGSVSRIVFSGLAGNDAFTNLSAIPSRADGGPGADVLRGGRATDELVGGAGNDDLQGGAGDDSLDAGKGDDRLDGQVGRDRLVGGEGLDREVDTQDRFADGDDDGDGFDNDYDSLDVARDIPGNPRAFADDSAVASIIAAVGDRLRAALQIPATDPGLRVRVQINGGTVSQPGRFGELVSGVWRYLTPDKIQVWAKWCYPASDPTRISLFAQYSYTGPYSGIMSDYSNPANYVVSEENRLYAGFLSGPVMFVSWLPKAPAGFFYSAPNQQATGFPAPIDQLKTALGSLPDFSQNGDSFQGAFSTTAGLEGVQPILSLLRTINQVNRTWYGQLRTR